MVARDEPVFVDYESEEDYRDHYWREYCEKEIYTLDGIRVHFQPSRFDHGFFENKDSQFSKERAKRIGWIRPALTSTVASHFTGWDRDSGSENFTRRVAVLDRFVVVLNLKLDGHQTLKAEYWTCYPASQQTFEKILKSHPWDEDRARKELRWRQKRRIAEQKKGRGRRRKKKVER